MLGLSAFWSTVVRVEIVNLAFSIDSILVAVAMSRKTWVVVLGGVLGIVAMRIVAGQLIELIRKYPAIVDGAFVIIGWVGVKLLLEYAHQVHWIGWEIPKTISLGPDRRDLRRSRICTPARAGRRHPTRRPTSETAVTKPSADSRLAVNPEAFATAGLWHPRCSGGEA